MHGVTAYGLLVLTGRRSVAVRRKLIITMVAAVVSVAVIDFEGFAHAEASRGSATFVVSTDDAVSVESPPDAPWAADESRDGTRPDAVH